MIGNDWDIVLKSVWESEGFHKFMNKVKEEYRTHTCYPAYENIFNALKSTPYSNVKIVILGQDPYHGVNQAEGLSFSVKTGIQKPPSLQNIFKELESDLGYKVPQTGSLVPWTKEGVLLLNTVLTVEANKPASHKDLGWEIFTDEVIKKINEKTTPVVFILWGNFARNKKKLITNPIHYIIESPHPSPFSAYSGFFGSKPFSKTNNFLISKGINPINWEIK